MLPNFEFPQIIGKLPISENAKKPPLIFLPRRKISTNRCRILPYYKIVVNMLKKIPRLLLAYDAHKAA